MKKSKFSTILSVFVVLLLSSCVVDNSVDPEENDNLSVIELSVSNLTPGYFDLTWDEVDGASWYFIKIEKDGVAISDTYTGSLGLQSGLITNGIAQVSVLSDVKAGETYTVTVTATDYMIGGVSKAIGTKEVSMPALPSELIGTWTSTGSVGNNWTFNDDGTITTLDTDASYTMSWTIENSDFVIRKHFSSNDQIDRYVYEISDDGNTLTLALNGLEFVLTKITND